MPDRERDRYRQLRDQGIPRDRAGRDAATTPSDAPRPAEDIPVAELKAMARGANVHGRSEMRKQELIARAAPELTRDAQSAWASRSFTTTGADAKNLVGDGDSCRGVGCAGVDGRQDPHIADWFVAAATHAAMPDTGEDGHQREA